MLSPIKYQSVFEEKQHVTGRCSNWGMELNFPVSFEGLEQQSNNFKILDSTKSW